MTSRNANWQGMNWIRQEKRYAIYLRDGLACVWCKATIEDTTLSSTIAPRIVRAATTRPRTW